MTSENHAKRLGELIRQRRKALKLTQADVQKMGGPSTATLRLIEGGKHVDFRSSTSIPLERVLEWTPGSIDSILAGGDPVIATEQAVSGEQLSRLRHPMNSLLVEEARETQDPEIVRVLYRVLTGDLDAATRAQAAHLMADIRIRRFPDLFEKLTREGKLRVVDFGREVRAEELQQWGRQREERDRNVDTPPSSQEPPASGEEGESQMTSSDESEDWGGMDPGADWGEDRDEGKDLG